MEERQLIDSMKSLKTALDISHICNDHYEYDLKVVTDYLAFQKKQIELLKEKFEILTNELEYQIKYTEKVLAAYNEK